jgi:ribosomal protein S18 acetylase RimI-like enzyme
VNEPVLIEDGWQLCPTAAADFDVLMQWFPDARSVDIWGGPRFRYPFTPESFREDCRFGRIQSFSLRNHSGELAAFGQVYDRDGHGHLARLVSNPAMRRQGVGRRLIEMIMRAAGAAGDYDGFSLFVYRDNEPAYRCYLDLGFVVQPFPEGAALADECFFLTRPANSEST